MEQRIGELEVLIDIGDAIKRFISTYSGGMKRRLDLAAALIHNPEILFLDEPTTGLDPISRNKVWDEVQRINKELGVTIFLTTQVLEEADVQTPLPSPRGMISPKHSKLVGVCGYGDVL